MKKKLPQSSENWVLVPTKSETKKKYYFSDHGRMRSVDKITQTFITGSRAKNGSTVLNLHLGDKKRQSFYLHRLIAQAFLPAPEDDQHFLIHIDGNKENNYYKNLRWVTQDELTRHHRELGVFDRDTDQGYKLNETKVILLKQRLKAKRTKPKIIAKNFDISLVHLRRIERGQHWGHVEV